MATNDPNDPNDIIDIDDFSDEDLLSADDTDSSLDDGEIYDDENWEDEAPAQNKPVKKKSSLFGILVVAGALVIGGGILFFQFTKSPATAPQAAVETASPVAPTAAESSPSPGSDLVALQQEETPVETPQAPATAPAQQEQGFMNNPVELEQAVGAMQPPPQQEAEIAPVPQNLPSIDQIKKAPSIEAEPLEASPVAPSIKPPVMAQETAPAAETPAQAAITETPSPAVAGQTGIEEALQEPSRNPSMSEKLDQVMSRLDAPEKKQSAPSTSAAPDLQRLSAALERLENKVDKLSSSKSSSSSASFSEGGDIKVTPAPRKKRTLKKKSVSESAYSMPDGWVLRSARPGEAMVSKPGQADLRSVRVGDSIVGIGQIQAITQMGGQWIVQGTSGRITQ